MGEIVYYYLPRRGDHFLEFSFLIVLHNLIPLDVLLRHHITFLIAFIMAS